MSYYLRVEGVNLGNFVSDTNDLSTTRGGSLLLLNAMDEVEKIIVNHLPTIQPDHNEQELLDIKRLNDLKSKNKLVKKEKKEKNKLQKKVKGYKSNSQGAKDSSPTITKGASWGLFDLQDDLDKALEIKKKVIDLFDKDNDKAPNPYLYATFVIDLQEKSSKDYQTPRNKLQTLNRWQQLQTPTLAIPTPDEEVCDFDKASPAPISSKQNNEFQSNSVRLRRDYGKDQKRLDFYKNTAKITEELEFTNDLDSLSKDTSKGILNRKIALIYIDGNSFGKHQKEANTPQKQTRFDQNTRNGREQVLENLIEEIKKDKHRKHWRNGNQIRLETLLWGGDEIIWVVPAWQGLWTLDFFYRHANKYIRNGNEVLFHASSIVFCHHNAPIHGVIELAKNMADNFAKECDRKKNLIAYQSLKSFDHTGTNIHKYRNKQLGKLSQNINDLLIEDINLGDIQDSINTLKKEDFPHRKLYQIVEAYQNEQDEHAQHLIEKLEPSHTTIINNLRSKFGDGSADENAHWLHLIDLWDYIASEEGEK